MAYKIKKAKIEKNIFKLKNGKLVRGYRIVAFEGITPLVVWNTMDEKEAKRFKKSWEN